LDKHALSSRIYEVLEVGDPDDRASRMFGIFLISLITLNALALIIGTVRSIYEAVSWFFKLFEAVTLFIRRPRSGQGDRAKAGGAAYRGVGATAHGIYGGIRRCVSGNCRRPDNRRGIAILGIGLFALPAGILGSGFLEELQHRRRSQVRICPHCGGEVHD
jgi:hypothetical protein